MWLYSWIRLKQSGGLRGGGSSLLWHLDQHTPIWRSLSCHLNHSHLPTPPALIKFNKTIWKQPHSWAPTALICVNLIRHKASFSSLTVGFAAYKIAENHNGKYCWAIERSPIVTCNKNCLTSGFESKTLIWFNSLTQVKINTKTRSSWLNCALRDGEAVYWVSIGHYEAVAVGNWWYWVSRGHLCRYILHKVEIWTGVTDVWLTDSLTDFER